MRSTSWRSTNAWMSSSGPSTNAGSRRPASRMSREAAARWPRASASESTPARASASAHARLPVTSSSKSRRSKGSDTPYCEDGRVGFLVETAGPEVRHQVSFFRGPGRRPAGPRMRGGGLDGQPAELDETRRGAVVERVALAVGGEGVVVERERRRRPDHVRRALEQLDAHRAGHPLLDLGDEGVHRLAHRRVPQAVVDHVGVLQPPSPASSAERSRGLTKSSSSRVRQVKHDGRGRLVDLAGLDADEPVLDHVDAADAVVAGDGADAGDRCPRTAWRRR